jgi:hypothetical protein
VRRRSLDKEESMSSQRTFSRAVGLVFLAAALGSGTAMAAGPTPAGVKADGLRWQAIARAYQQTQSPTPAGIKADGLRWQAIAKAYKEMQSPTPAGVKADGLRWQAIARTYGVHTATTPSSSGNGFDLGVAGIVALAGLGLAVLASGLTIMARRIRRTKLAV